MHFGITLGRLNPHWFVRAAAAADALGFESVWMADHVVLPVGMEGSLHGGSRKVAPETPVLDPSVLGAHVAATTSSVRIGTFVYLLGLRHPFVAARSFATLDFLSKGRVVLGVGAGWITSEWEACGQDPATRGARLAEAIAVCRRLWTEPVVSHDGPHFPFEPVAFNPKPCQQPIPIGGESKRALARAADLGDGWMKTQHTPESAAQRVAELREGRADGPRTGRSLEVTVLGTVTSRDDVRRYEDAGVDRLIVAPWSRSSEAIENMRRFAATKGLRPNTEGA